MVEDGDGLKVRSNALLKVFIVVGVAVALALMLLRLLVPPPWKVGVISAVCKDNLGLFPDDMGPRFRKFSCGKIDSEVPGSTRDRR